MEKIRKSVTFMIIYLMLFTQILFAQSNSNIRLPKIPVYSNYDLEFPYYRTSKKNEAYLVLDVTQGKSFRGVPNWIKYISYPLGTFLGFKIGNYIDESKGTGAITGAIMGTTSGFTFTVMHFNGNAGPKFGLSGADLEFGELAMKITTFYNVVLKNPRGEIKIKKRIFEYLFGFDNKYLIIL